MKRILVAVVLLAGISLPSYTSAQITLGQVTGTVTDYDNAKIPGAQVTLRNESTKVTSTVLTDDSGNFKFRVQPGLNYTLTVELAGFKRVTIKKVPIRLGDPTIVEVKLEPASFTII